MVAGIVVSGDEAWVSRPLLQIGFRLVGVIP